MIEITPALNSARLEGVLWFLVQGIESATAQIYEGSRPALGSMPNGRMLAAIPLATPAGIVTGGILTLAPGNEVMIANTGIAGWARVVNGNGDVAWDCDVSELNGGAEIQLATLQLYAGGFTRLVSGKLS
jgi:hypothetical protein